MDFEIRPLTAEDAPRVRAILSTAFSRGRTVAPDERSDAEYVANRWGAFQGEKLQSILGIRPFQVYWGGETTLPMGGISGVATSPEARGRGHVDALLREGLRAMHEAGQVVSALYPFSWSFYRTYGWDWVGEQRELTLPLAELKKAPEGADVTMLAAADCRDALKAPYSTYARQFRGANTAETHQWNALRESDGKSVYVFQYAPTGEYFVWRYPDGDNPGSIREWVAWSPEGHRALLSQLHHLANQIEKATLTVAANTLLPHFLMHWDLKVKTEPMFAARVVDVAAALNAMGPVQASPDGSLALAIRDDHAPWNNAVHLISVEDHRVTCTTRHGDHDYDVDLQMDIQAFSQAFWGGYEAMTGLQAAGRIEARSEAEFGVLARILGAAHVYTLDFF